MNINWKELSKDLHLLAVLLGRGTKVSIRQHVCASQERDAGIVTGLHHGHQADVLAADRGILVGRFIVTVLRLPGVRLLRSPHDLG